MLRVQLNYMTVRLNLDIILAKQGRFAEAREQFAEALRLDPTRTAARQFLEGLQAEGNATGASSPSTRP